MIHLEKTRAQTLSEAHELITGEREQQYGAPEESFGKIAQLWSMYLRRPVTAYDVAFMLHLLKTGRLMNGFHKDSNVDSIGYLALASEMAAP